MPILTPPSPPPSDYHLTGNFNFRQVQYSLRTRSTSSPNSSSSALKTSSIKKRAPISISIPGSDMASLSASSLPDHSRSSAYLPPTENDDNFESRAKQRDAENTLPDYRLLQYSLNTIDQQRWSEVSSEASVHHHIAKSATELKEHPEHLSELEPHVSTRCLLSDKSSPENSSLQLRFVQSSCSIGTGAAAHLNYPFKTSSKPSSSAESLNDNENDTASRNSNLSADLIESAVASSSASTSAKSCDSASTQSSISEDDIKEMSDNNGSSTSTKVVITRKSKAQSYRLLSSKTKTQQSAHIYPAHTKYVSSLLTREQNPLPNTSYAGFHHLAMIILVASNIRLLVDDFHRYGFIMTLSRLGITKQDSRTCIYLLALAPAHLFVALAIEKLANHLLHQNETPPQKQQLKQQKPHRPKHLWLSFAFAHSINALLVLTITSLTVYYQIRHPIIGTICECHALVLCLKIASYALVNRDLRYLAGYNDPSLIPELYQPNEYPKNLTLSNLIYFWWAPTLMYQPVYPRSAKIRWRFVATRLFEMAGLGVIIWFLAGQYAIPMLEASLPHFISGDVKGIVQSLLNLASVSIVIWLLGFVFLFQSYLNFLAELLRFADREFYQDWWNSGSVGAYWRLWNKPVTNYFKRHLYIPLLKRGHSPIACQGLVFFVSALLHEMLVGIPTKQIIGVAFACMLLQVPLIAITAPLEKMRGPGTTIGNCIFWLSFFFGQPFAVLIYYYAWNVRHPEQQNGALV